jgi:hypothetical protein
MADQKELPAGRPGKRLYHDEGDGTLSESVASHLRGWNTTTLSWQRVAVNDSGELLTAGGGGGGGAVTIADGADVAQGATTDLDTANTVVGLLKKIKSLLSGTLAVSAASLPLPSGAATSAKQDSQTTLLGAGLPSALASDRLKVDGSGVTQPVSGPLTDAQLRAANVNVAVNAALPAGTNAVGKLAANDGVDIGDVTINNASIAVTGPLTDAQLRASAVPVKETRAATATVTSVADTASSTTLLASNASRLGASITNDSSARLYVKLGTTASATDYTVSLAQNDYYEVPFGYTGRIDGIWASDPNAGAARITEYV